MPKISWMLLGLLLWSGVSRSDEAKTLVKMANFEAGTLELKNLAAEVEIRKAEAGSQQVMVIIKGLPEEVKQIEVQKKDGQVSISQNGKATEVRVIVVVPQGTKVNAENASVKLAE